MSLETGLNFELFHKNTAASKRHCKRYFYLKFLVGKESMCHVMQNGWYCVFSAPFLIFMIWLIRYWDDKIKWDLKGSIKFVWSYMTTKLLWDYFVLYSSKKMHLTQKRNYGFLQYILYFAWSVVIVKFILQ